MLSPVARQRLAVAVALVVLVFLAVFFYYSGQHTLRVRASGQVTPVMQAPMWLAYLAMPAGSALMFLRACQVIWRLVRDRQARRPVCDGSEGLTRDGMTIALMFGLLALGLFLTVPMFIVLTGTAFIIIALTTPIPLSILPQRVFAGLEVFPLLAIPFFILAANIMGRGGLSARLISFIQSPGGHLPGGLG